MTQISERYCHMQLQVSISGVDTLKFCKNKKFMIVQSLKKRKKDKITGHMSSSELKSEMRKFTFRE